MLTKKNSLKKNVKKKEYLQENVKRKEYLQENVKIKNNLIQRRTRVFFFIHWSLRICGEKKYFSSEMVWLKGFFLTPRPTSINGTCAREFIAIAIAKLLSIYKK